MGEGEGGGGRDDQQEKDESVNKDEAVKVYKTDENLAREQEGRVSFSVLLSKLKGDMVTDFDARSTLRCLDIGFED
jgi:hypothetical protein